MLRFTTPAFLPCVSTNTIHLLLHFTTPTFLPSVHFNTVHISLHFTTPDSFWVSVHFTTPRFLPVYTQRLSIFTSFCYPLNHLTSPPPPPPPTTLTFNKPHLLTVQRSTTPTCGTRRGWGIGHRAAGPSRACLTPRTGRTQAVLSWLASYRGTRLVQTLKPCNMTQWMVSLTSTAIHAQAVLCWPACHGGTRFAQTPKPCNMIQSMISLTPRVWSPGWHTTGELALSRHSTWHSEWYFWRLQLYLIWLYSPGWHTRGELALSMQTLKPCNMIQSYLQHLQLYSPGWHPPWEFTMFRHPNTITWHSKWYLWYPEYTLLANMPHGNLPCPLKPCNIIQWMISLTPPAVLSWLTHNRGTHLVQALKPCNMTVLSLTPRAIHAHAVFSWPTHPRAIHAHAVFSWLTHPTAIHAHAVFSWLAHLRAIHVHAVFSWLAHLRAIHVHAVFSWPTHPRAIHAHAVFSWLTHCWGTCFVLNQTLICLRPAKHQPDTWHQELATSWLCSTWSHAIAEQALTRHSDHVTIFYKNT